MGTNPSKFVGDENPVEQVNWDEAIAFCNKLSEMPEEKTVGHRYRLPTEAEWELACRAGTTSARYFGESASGLTKYAWFEGNSNAQHHPVGTKQPNHYGLFDMHGNVYEWCSDWYGDYNTSESLDPIGPGSGRGLSDRVLRGGGFGNKDKDIRSAVRGWAPPSHRSAEFGFRVVLEKNE